MALNSHCTSRYRTGLLPRAGVLAGRTLKMRILLPRALPGEKRQCVGWSPGWRCQELPSWSVLFLPAQVSQDSVDDILIFNAGNGPAGTSATATDLDVDLENPLEPLGPGHGGVTFSR